MTQEGILISRCPFSVKEAMDKLQSFITSHGGTIYARIDQQAEVKKSGGNRLPLEFLLFGNPAVGGKIMQENPLAALDLPLKIIAWEDKEQVVRVAWNDAAFIQHRYALKPDPSSPLFLDKLIQNALTVSDPAPD